MELRDYVKELRHIHALIRQGMFYETDSRVTSSSYPDKVWLQVPVRKSKLENPYEGPFQVLSSRPPNYVIDYKGTERTVHITQVKPVNKSMTGNPNYVIVNDDESTDDEEPAGLAPNIEEEEYDSFEDVPQPRLTAPDAHHYPERIKRGCSVTGLRTVV